MKKIIVLAFLILIIIPAGSALAHEDKSGKTVVHMLEATYDPVVFEIKVGDTVIFENVSNSERWPASDIHPTHAIYPEFDPKQTIAPGESWEFTFTKPGIWRMHDHVKPTITGTITVTGNAIEATQPTESKPLWHIRQWHKVTRWWHKMRLDMNDAKIKDHEYMRELHIEKFGGEQTIKNLSEIFNNEAGACHEVAHETGRYAYEYYGNDVFSAHSPECMSGYIHGATEAYFKKFGTDNLEKNLNIICNDKQDNAFYAHQCFHGIGHGLTAWTSYDIPASLEYCDLLRNFQSSCYSGVFMENVLGGLTNDGGAHHSKYLSDDPHMPCNAVKEKYVSDCYFYQTSRMLKINSSFEFVANECRKAPNVYSQFLCFTSMGRDAGAVVQHDIDKSVSTCRYAEKTEYIDGCLNGVVKDLFWDTTKADRAIAFCNGLPEANQTSCITSISQLGRDIFSGAERDKFCDKIPNDRRYICSNAMKL